MRYFIDTEFDGYRGPLISMALVREDGRSLYFVMKDAADNAQDFWVTENVIPLLTDSPEPPYMIGSDDAAGTAEEVAAFLIAVLFGDDPHIVIEADWPDDIRHLCNLLHHSPGKMVPGPDQTIEFRVHRVDAYPTTLPGAVQHVAWWDAVALKEKITSAVESWAASSADDQLSHAPGDN